MIFRSIKRVADFSGVVGREVLVVGGSELVSASVSRSVWSFNLDTKMWRLRERDTLRNNHNGLYSFWMEYHVLVEK